MSNEAKKVVAWMNSMGYAKAQPTSEWRKWHDTDNGSKFESMTDSQALCFYHAEQARVQRVLDRVKELGPDDVEVEDPGYDPPTDPMVAADQAFNQSNKQWRSALAQLRKEEL